MLIGNPKGKKNGAWVLLELALGSHGAFFENINVN